MRKIFILSLAFTIASIHLIHAQSGYLDKTTIDPSIKPGDDFYSYANGSWFKTNEIPTTEAAWGNWAIINKQTRFRLQDLITEVAAKKNQRVPLKQIPNPESKIPNHLKRFFSK